MGDSLEPFVPKPRVSENSAAMPALSSMPGSSTYTHKSSNQQEIDAAANMAKQGFYVAIFIAVVTGVCAQLGLVGLDKSALLDAFVFVAIGVGIYNTSRVAAVAGLLIFVAEKIYMWSTHGFSNPLMAIFIAGAFLNSVRGTFKYHELNR